MGIFRDIQDQLDQKLGFISPEITSNRAEAIVAAGTPVGKEEFEWYPTTMFISQDRQNRYMEYEEMTTNSLISSALDIYADDSTQLNPEGHVLSIVSDNQQVKEELEWFFFKRLDIDSILWNIVRRSCTYGDAFYEIVLQEDRAGVLFLKPLPSKTMVRFERDGRLIGFLQMIPSGGSPEFDPFQVVHFKVQDDSDMYRPYGISILEPARRPYRQLRLMEDAMVVYRITRAPERRVFYVNVGNLPTAKAEEYIQKMMMKFRKKAFVNPITGELDYKSNPLAVDEDFYMPIRGGQEGTKIESLPGAQNLNEIDDVKYFKDKILAAVKIPRAYLQSEDGSARGWNEPRANLSQQDVRFSRTTQRVQRHIAKGLFKVAYVHLLLRGFTKKDLYSFKIDLTPSSYVSELMLGEVMNNRFAHATAYYDMRFPREWIAEHVLKINAEEYKKLRAQRDKDDIAEAKLEADKQAASQPPEPEQSDEGMAPEGGEEMPAEGSPEGVSADEMQPEGENIENVGDDEFTYENRKIHKDKYMIGTYSRLLVEGELEGAEGDRSDAEMNEFKEMVNEYIVKNKGDGDYIKEDK